MTRIIIIGKKAILNSINSLKASEAKNLRNNKNNTMLER